MSNYMGCGAQIDKENLEQKLLDLEDSRQYVAEEKLDGQWAEIWVNGGTVVKIVSRTGKLKPFEPLLKYRFPMVTGIFIGEIGYGSSNSKLKENIAVIYDWAMVVYKGVKIKASKAHNELRRAILEQVLNKLNPGVLLVERKTDWFFQFYLQVLREKGEGLIIKKRFGTDTFYKKGTRCPNWYKVKKEIEVDMVIMGVDWRESKGMSKITKDKGADKYIKHIRCGQFYKGKLREEVKVGSMTDSARKHLSTYDLVGRVVTIRGFEQFPKTGSIRHCSLYTRDDGSFLRGDLAPEDCVFGKIKII